MVVIVSVMLFKMIKNVENKISKPNLLEAQEYIESTKFLEDDAIDSDYEEA
jgi:hypothetical protein